MRAVVPPDRGRGDHRDQDRRHRFASGETARAYPGHKPGRGREHGEPDRDRHGGLTVVTEVGQHLDQRGERQDRRHPADHPPPPAPPPLPPPPIMPPPPTPPSPLSPP